MVGDGEEAEQGDQDDEETGCQQLEGGGLPTS